MIAHTPSDPALRPAWAKCERILRGFGLVADEEGLRARRALSELTRETFIPEPVHQVAQAHSMTVAGLVYSSNPANRARRARLLRDLFAEADTVRAEIGWAS